MRLQWTGDRPTTYQGITVEPGAVLEVPEPVYWTLAQRDRWLAPAAPESAPEAEAEVDAPPERPKGRKRADA